MEDLLQRARLAADRLRFEAWYESAEIMEKLAASVENAVAERDAARRVIVAAGVTGSDAPDGSVRGPVGFSRDGCFGVDLAERQAILGAHAAHDAALEAAKR
jgi:hypothetical protein